MSRSSGHGDDWKFLPLSVIVSLDLPLLTLSTFPLALGDLMKTSLLYASAWHLVKYFVL